MNTDVLPVVPLDDRHLVERFDSGVDELDRWLRRMARIAGVVGTGATYVLALAQPVDPATLQAGERPEGTADGPLHEVVGYYTLAVRSIEQDLGPRLLARGVPESVSVIHLPRLAVHRDWQGVGLGAELLVEALRRAVQAGTAIGARAVVVDAVDEAALTFYQHMGFEELEGMRLFKSMGDLTAIL